MSQRSMLLFGRKRRHMNYEDWIKGCSNLLCYWRGDGVKPEDFSTSWKVWYDSGMDCPTAVHEALGDQRYLPTCLEEVVE